MASGSGAKAEFDAIRIQSKDASEDPYQSIYINRSAPSLLLCPILRPFVLSQSLVTSLLLRFLLPSTDSALLIRLALYKDALMQAVGTSYSKCVQALLAGGADATLRNSKGQTAPRHNGKGHSESL